MATDPSQVTVNISITAPFSLDSDMLQRLIVLLRLLLKLLGRKSLDAPSHITVTTEVT